MYLLLALLMIINVASVAGYAIFTLNPIMMVKYPSTIPFFTISYPLFARLQIGVAFVCFAWALYRHARWRWLAPFAGVVAVALMSELGGTSIGIPFGKYEYSGLLGPKVFGKVPFLVPLSWFFMSVPSFDFAHRLLKPTAPLFARLMVAASFLLVWDVTLDPAMSKLTPFWAWSKPGFLLRRAADQHDRLVHDRRGHHGRPCRDQFADLDTPPTARVPAAVLPGELVASRGHGAVRRFVGGVRAVVQRGAGVRVPVLPHAGQLAVALAPPAARGRRVRRRDAAIGLVGCRSLPRRQ